MRARCWYTGCCCCCCLCICCGAGIKARGSYCACRVACIILHLQQPSVICAQYRVSFCCHLVCHCLCVCLPCNHHSADRGIDRRRPIVIWQTVHFTVKTGACYIWLVCDYVQLLIMSALDSRIQGKIHWKTDTYHLFTFMFDGTNRGPTDIIQHINKQKMF